MWTAILLVCLISAPDDCRSHEMLINTAMPTSAWVEANVRAAEWLLKHPGYVKRGLRVVSGRGA